jgi:hypothetical protein
MRAPAIRRLWKDPLPRLTLKGLNVDTGLGPDRAGAEDIAVRHPHRTDHASARLTQPAQTARGAELELVPLAEDRGGCGVERKLPANESLVGRFLDDADDALYVRSAGLDLDQCRSQVADADAREPEAVLHRGPG